MQGIKKVNNNIALCIDSQGRQVLAMGRGVGFGAFPRTIELSQIERTFYHINDSHIQLVQNVPEEILQISDDIVNQAQRVLPYAIGPNATLSMADHIHFAIQRLEQNIDVQMPLTFDVALQYPMEMEIAEDARRQIKEKLKKELPRTETVGIALALVNAKVSSGSVQQPAGFDEMLAMTTDIVEKCNDIRIDRSSFHYARFASHVYYLYQRITQKKVIASDNTELYLGTKQSFPKIAECVDEITKQIEDRYNAKLTDEEQLYLMLHVNRILSKETTN